MALPLLGGVVGTLVTIGSGIASLVRGLKASKWGAWLMFSLFTFMGGLIGRLMQLLGITLVANTFATPVFRDLVVGKLLGLPPVWLGFIGLTKVDQAITIILSAVAIRVVDQVRVKRRRDEWQTPL